MFWCNYVLKASCDVEVRGDEFRVTRRGEDEDVVVVELVTLLLSALGHAL